MTGAGIFSLAPLDLRFALQKTLDPRVTFTRASTGTYVGSDGVLQSAVTNEARFDHNPTTGESLGLLVEEARTNLLLRSEEFESASWTNGNTTESSNVAVAPNGTSTADKLIENSGAGFKAIEQALAISALTYTFSIHVKAVERSIVQLLWSGGASTNFANFNLATGAVTAGTYTSATITPAGSDWFRLSITSALAAGTFSGIVSLQTNASAARAASYTGDGTSGLFLWGAQLEAGAFPTSYIPTTTATATRAADVASITGTAFSSFYNQTEGTAYASYAERAFSVTHQVVTFSNGTANERISFAVNASNILDVAVVSGGTDTFTGNTPTLTAQEYQIGFGYKADNSGVSANGSAITVDSAVTLPTVSQLDIGARAGSSQILNSTIRRLTYWPVRLANPTLVSITQP